MSTGSPSPNPALSLPRKGQSEVKPMPTRIESIEQLKAEAEQGAEFFILLNHGLRSSKDIVWDAKAKKFHIFNHIDQTEQHLTERQLMDRGFTNIGYAMKRGALFRHDF
jgi:hypothetical protein